MPFQKEPRSEMNAEDKRKLNEIVLETAYQIAYDLTILLGLTEKVGETLYTVVKTRSDRNIRYAFRLGEESAAKPVMEIHNELDRSTGIDDANSVIPFGKYRGRTIAYVLGTNPGWLLWANETVLWFKLSDRLKAVVIDAKRAQQMPRHRNKIHYEMFDEDRYCDDPPDDDPDAWDEDFHRWGGLTDDDMRNDP